MPRWQVELSGHPFDLEELPALLSAPSLRVLESEGHYLLEAEQFESLEEAAAVHTTARALLPRINGVGKLKNRGFRAVDVGRVHELSGQGDRRQHVFLQVDSAILRSKVSAVLIKQGEEEPEGPPPGSLETDNWMRAASLDPKAARALALWGGPHEPINLWKVWELVRDSGVAIDPELRRRFRPALHNRSIAGEEARHELPSGRVEPDTMSVEEAEGFLGDLLAAWLASLNP
jgi:hypothetical protein